MKYKITPVDVANYFLISNLRVSQEHEVIQDLFQQHNLEIAFPFRKDFRRFRTAIYDYINGFDLSDEDFTEADLILKEVSDGIICSFQDEVDAYDHFAFYFKLVKLEVMYSQKHYKRLKLRTILREFGYQRRSNVLMENLNRTLKALKLSTYLRGNEKCRIADVSLDDMIIIRI